MLTLFLAALGVGIVWALWLLPRGQVRAGYMAWMAATAFAVLAASLGLGWMASREVDPWLAVAAGGILTYRLLIPLGGQAALAGLALASALGAACLAHLGPAGGMALPSIALSAMVLGTALDAMVLGHWYLVQHGLSFEPLKRMSAALLWVVSARLALALLWLFALGGWGRLMEAPSMDRTMFLLLRGLVGLAGPLGLGWMVRECVKLKSNTSATGILYVVCVFVLMGEFTAAWFWTETGAWL